MLCLRGTLEEGGVSCEGVGILMDGGWGMRDLLACLLASLQEGYQLSWAFFPT